MIKRLPLRSSARLSVVRKVFGSVSGVAYVIRDERGQVLAATLRPAQVYLEHSILAGDRDVEGVGTLLAIVAGAGGDLHVLRAVVAGSPSRRRSRVGVYLDRTAWERHPPRFAGSIAGRLFNLQRVKLTTRQVTRTVGDEAVDEATTEPLVYWSKLRLVSEIPYRLPCGSKRMPSCERAYRWPGYVVPGDRVDLIDQAGLRLRECRVRESRPGRFLGGEDRRLHLGVLGGTNLRRALLVPHDAVEPLPVRTLREDAGSVRLEVGDGDLGAATRLVRAVEEASRLSFHLVLRARRLFIRGPDPGFVLRVHVPQVDSAAITLAGEHVLRVPRRQDERLLGITTGRASGRRRQRIELNWPSVGLLLPSDLSWAYPTPVPASASAVATPSAAATTTDRRYRASLSLQILSKLLLLST